MAHSMGGRAAAALALRDPKQRVRGLVLSGTTGGVADEAVQRRRETRRRRRAAAAASALSRYTRPTRRQTRRATSCCGRSRAEPAAAQGLPGPAQPTAAGAGRAAAPPDVRAAAGGRPARAVPGRRARHDHPGRPDRDVPRTAARRRSITWRRAPATPSIGRSRTSSTRSPSDSWRSSMASTCRPMTAPSLLEPAVLAGRFLAELDALPVASTEPIRALRRDYSRRLKSASSAYVWEFVLALQPILRRGTPQRAGLRWVVCVFVADHRTAFESVDADRLEGLGAGMQSWDEVDAFARILAGPAWLHGLVSDDTIYSWARSPDLWWRRAALVSTVALNMRSQGGTGDMVRTLAVCELLAGDREVMVQKDHLLGSPGPRCSRRSVCQCIPLRARAGGFRHRQAGNAPQARDRLEEPTRTCQR